MPDSDDIPPRQKIELQGIPMSEFRAQAARDKPAAANFLLITQINALWQLAAMQPGVRAEAERQALELHSTLREMHRSRGAQQRELDLQTLRIARERAGLVIVIGAGVSMGAGLPSWPRLVHSLLTSALESLSLQARERVDVQNLLARIDAGGKDDTLLLTGAALAQTLLAARFIDRIAQALYACAPHPSPVHAAIAEAAFPMQPKLGALHGPRGMRSGWDAIINYNFDVLMDEALDEIGVARESFAMQHGVPWPFRPSGIENVPSQLLTKVLHMHGRVPRPPEIADQPRLVFSAQQYRDAYDGERDLIIDSLVKRNLTVPGHYALYVGCSFQDEAMNGLLREAWQKRPGRSHYALLRWEGARVVAESTADEIEAAGERFTAMGIQPIWFDRYDELADVIHSFA